MGTIFTGRVIDVIMRAGTFSLVLFIPAVLLFCHSWVMRSPFVEGEVIVVLKRIAVAARAALFLFLFGSINSMRFRYRSISGPRSTRNDRDQLCPPGSSGNWAS